MATTTLDQREWGRMVGVMGLGMGMGLGSGMGSRWANSFQLD